MTQAGIVGPPLEFSEDDNTGQGSAAALAGMCLESLSMQTVEIDGKPMFLVIFGEEFKDLCSTAICHSVDSLHEFLALIFSQLELDPASAEGLQISQGLSQVCHMEPDIGGTISEPNGANPGSPGKSAGGST